MDLKERILIALGLDKKEEELKLAFQAKTEDGTIIVSTAEELESGVDVSVLTEDGTTIPLPAGTYKLDTGVSFRVESDKEGIVSEVMESETEEEDTADDMKEEKEQMSEELEDKEKDNYEEEFPETPAEKADWAKSYEELKDKVDNLEDAIADMKKMMGETGDVEEMSEETVEDMNTRTDSPKTVTTKTTEVVEFSIDELKAENEKLKAELSAKPAEAPVNTNKFSTDRPTLTKKQYNKLTKQERFLYNLNKY
ncbi:MAG: hypothetical protein Tp1111DCM843611_12 [Prokaryotic dsDNA virus sp.]|nr:MAG: hypothetical protein Tp1111DCM843611_12 [Prokaryotic dsDNA virus sp.]|tara:strand:+ start:20517 stop:21275 length:759 start_codon:yes stop_codon:yes gene_type:complete